MTGCLQKGFLSTQRPNNTDTILVFDLFTCGADTNSSLQCKVIEIGDSEKLPYDVHLTCYASYKTLPGSNAPPGWWEKTPQCFHPSIQESRKKDHLKILNKMKISELRNAGSMGILIYVCTSNACVPCLMFVLCLK